MRRAVLVIISLAGAVAIAAAVHRRARADRADGPGTRARMESRMARMMEQRMARMPATAPPRVMFDNLAAIREQTTRILELLEKDAGSPAAGERPPQEQEG